MKSGFYITVFMLVVPCCDSVHSQLSAERRDTSNVAALLIPASATMTTAWDFPRNPLTDSSVNSLQLREQIRWGFNLFINTNKETPRFARNKLVCNNCHLNAGQKEKAMPLVGVAAAYPEYNKRAGRVFTLEDRIVGCFTRSQCAVRGASSTALRADEIPSTTSPEVQAIVSYLAWLSEGFVRGETIPWRGQNAIPKDKLIPISRLDTKRGRRLFNDKCSSCHGANGQGVAIGDKKAGPLWGRDSWNDGAGAARVYTLAGIIRFAMPYLDPGSLTDEEAQQIAAYINSQRRPAYPLKDEDYRVEPLPPDAVYYKRGAQSEKKQAP